MSEPYCVEGMKSGLEIQSDKALAGVEALVSGAAWYARRASVLSGVLKLLVEQAGEGLEDKAAKQARRAMQDKLDAMELASSRVLREEA